MPELNKPERTEPSRLARRSLLFRLPWRQVLSKKVLLITLSPVMLAALLTVPQMAVDAYAKAPGSAGALHAFAAVGLGLLLFAIIGVQLVFSVAVFWGLAIDIAGLYRDIRAGLKKLPAAWATFRADCAKFRAGCGRAWLRVRGIPAAARAMTAEQRAEAVFMVAAFAVLGGIAYLGWTPAAHLAARLPRWLLIEPDFMGILFIDIVGSTFVWAFTMPILTHLVFRLFPRLRRSRAGKTKKS